MAIILGIDPGSRVTGYGLINSVGNKLQYVHCGCVKTSSASQPERLKTIFTEICQVIEEYSPQQAAVEEVFMGKNRVLGTEARSGTWQRDGGLSLT